MFQILPQLLSLLFQLPNNSSLLLQHLLCSCLARRLQNSLSVTCHLFSVTAELCQHRASLLLLLSYFDLKACILFTKGTTAAMQDFFLVFQLLNSSLLNQDFSDFRPQFLLNRCNFPLNL